MTCLLNLMLLSAPLNMQAVEAQNTSFNMTELPGEIMEVVYLDSKGRVIQRGYLLNGEKTGTWITYDEKGQITAKAEYEEGQKQGKWKIYSETGKVEYKILYRNNKKIWAQQYDEQGNLEGFAYK